MNFSLHMAAKVSIFLEERMRHTWYFVIRPSLSILDENGRFLFKAVVWSHCPQGMSESCDVIKA
jgi:hypothetical protein